MDEKAAAAYHPFSSAEEMRQALKIRDEIAQPQVEGRETLSGVDLSVLPREKLRDLGQGNVILHEGIWCQIDEYEVQDQHDSIRLRLVHADVDPDAPAWERRIIAHMDEKFYVPIPAKGRAARRSNERHPSLVRRVPEGH
jgi:hypothetical protein